jgi:membrane protease YdiL (CAAX protease family)
MNITRRFPITNYLFAAFTITYVIGIGVYILLKNLQVHLGTHVPYVNDLGLKFGPSIAGILMMWLTGGGKSLRHLLARNLRWRAPVALYLLALAVPPATFAIALCMRGHASEVYALDPMTATTVFGMQLAVNTFLGGGMSEEFGWRGFMLPRLSQRYTPLIASLIVGIAWFAWHVPGYLLTDKAETDPILPFLLAVFPFSIVLARLYYGGGESLLLPILMHGSINASSYSILILMPKVTSSPTFQPANDWILAGLWIVVALVVVLRTGRQLGRSAGGPD